MLTKSIFLSLKVMLLGYQVCKIVMQEDEMSICDVLESV